jgi:hypothetical protein
MLSRAQMADQAAACQALAGQAIAYQATVGQAVGYQALADQAQGLPLHSCCRVVVGEWVVCWIASTYRQTVAI